MVKAVVYVINNQYISTMKAKKFKPHKMYGPNGEVRMVTTMKEHLTLKNKGWGHTPKKKKK